MSNSEEQLQSPSAVVQAFVRAMNDHDIETALSFFTDAAIARFPDQGREFTGRDGIREWLAEDIAQNVKIDLSDVQELGNTVTLHARVLVDPLRQAEMAPLEGQAVLVVEGGSI